MGVYQKRRNRILPTPGLISWSKSKRLPPEKKKKRVRRRSFFREEDEDTTDTEPLESACGRSFLPRPSFALPTTDANPGGAAQTQECSHLFKGSSKV